MSKLLAIFLKLLYYFIDLPIKIGRLIVHFFWFSKSKRKSIAQLRIVSSFSEWIIFIPFYVLDISGIPVLYEILLEFIFWKTRNLSSDELDIAFPYYRNALNYGLIRVNEKERFIARRLGIAYVSFNTIHTADTISAQLLIHELIHVWQYMQFGSIYMYKALRAQNSKEGYNYGGRSELSRVRSLRGGLLDFNFEQQGEILSDHFLISNDKAPEWIDKSVDNLKYLSYFFEGIGELKIFANRNISKNVTGKRKGMT